jgi:hypothetical protein
LARRRLTSAAFKEQADKRIQGFINGKTERSRTSNQYVHHYSDSRLEVLANIAASVVAIGILLMPAFILFLTDLSRGKMAAIVGFFVLVFIVIMSYLKGITPHSLIGVAM